MPSPRYWREKPSRFRLEAGRCKGCGKVVFPKRKICPSCRGREFEELMLERRAKVITKTVIVVAPDEFMMEEAGKNTLASLIHAANATKNGGGALVVRPGARKKNS